MKKLMYTILGWLIYASLSAASIDVTGKVTEEAYTGTDVTVKDQSELTLTSQTPLADSKVCLETANSWVIFENLRPSEVFKNYLKYVYVGNMTTKAVEGSNVRVEVYRQGTVIIPDAPSIEPLEVFTEYNYGGTSKTYPMYSSGTTPVIHTALGDMNNKISSFKLKRGYMATMATGNNGMGYSRVFIADQSDLEVPVIDSYLDKSVAFIRVVKWKYVSKKGWAGADSESINKVKASWCYDWGGSNGNWGTAGTNGDYLNAEYIPMRHYLFWDGWSSIQSRPNSTSALGFNEPENESDHKKDNPDNPYMTVDDCISLWPNLMANGLRLGSPATTDGRWDYLYEFIDKADALNYRVDFVAVHYYRGGKSASQLYSELKAIHDRTKRPLWLTEWNNGANWTNESWPTGLAAQEEKQLKDMTAFFNMLDTCSFVERYAIYDHVEAKRDFIRNGNETTGAAGTLTPAGEMMRDFNAKMAYNPAKAFVPLPWKFKAPLINATRMNADKTAFGIRFERNPNGNLTLACLVEKRVDAGDFVQIDSVASDVVTVEYPVNTGETNVSFRMRYVSRGGEYTAYSEETGYVFTPAEDIQINQMPVVNEKWSPIFFGKNFTTAPVAIFGTPTFNNRALITARSRNMAADKMEFRLLAWAYMAPNTITAPEYLPYFLLAEGQYNWGGLNAVAGKTTANGVWKTVAFETPFASVPAIFALQTSEKSATATAIRIRNVTENGFDILVQKESAQTYSVPTENVNYLAIEYGEGVVNGQKIIVGKTADKAVGTISTAGVKADWGESFENPMFFAFMQSANDNLGATLRLKAAPGATFAEFFKQAERSNTTTSAQLETAAWMVIDYHPNPTGIDTKYRASDALSIYPNPAKDFMYFNNPQRKSVHIQLYSLLGKQVKSLWENSNRIDVMDLPSGYYILKIDGKSFKFLKTE